MICLIALIFLLPRGQAPHKGTHPLTSLPYNGEYLNQSNLTTIYNATSFITTYTTTIVTPYNSSQYNYTYSFNQTISSYNDTPAPITYAYCVGSPTPPFNQSYFGALNESGAGPWESTTSYPIPFMLGSCSTFAGTVYCVGDSTLVFRSHSTKAFYANASQKGIGEWHGTNSYPVQFSDGSCSTYNNYIYCLGDSNNNYSSNVYYAPISRSGIGVWNKTTSYPAPFYDAQCNVYNSYIYCIGDQYFNFNSIVAQVQGRNTLTARQNLTSLDSPYAYYARISPSGVGSWKQIPSTPLLLNGGSCTISNSSIYCIGGSSSLQSLLAFAKNYSQSSSSGTSTLESLVQQAIGNDTSSSFYANILPNGSVGAWKQGPAYIDKLSQSGCVSFGGYMYCIGSSNSQQTVGFANVSSYFGISNWTQTDSYPIPFYNDYCSVNTNEQ